MSSLTIVMMNQASMTHHGNEFADIFVIHPSYQDSKVIYVAKCFCVLTQEGDPDGFFDDCVENAVAMDYNGNFDPETRD